MTKAEKKEQLKTNLECRIEECGIYEDKLKQFLNTHDYNLRMCDYVVTAIWEWNEHFSNNYDVIDENAIEEYVEYDIADQHHIPHEQLEYVKSYVSDILNRVTITVT
jgi:hypothetical protein